MKRLAKAWALAWGIPLAIATLLVIVILFIAQGPRAVAQFLEVVSL